METTTIVQRAGLLWNEYWANDILAMIMAILCSQQIGGILRGLYSHFFGERSLTVTSFDTFEILEILLCYKPSWSQLLLNLGYAVQFPLTAAFHPLVDPRNVNDPTSFPRLPHLIGQVTVLLIIDYSSQRFFAQRYEEIFDYGDPENDVSDNGDSSALEIATDFTASEVTLFLAITAMQLSSRLRYFTGGFHFAAIVCWLLLRS